MTYTHQNKGVCSIKTTITIQDGTDIIEKVETLGGCNGNLQGLSVLLEGMHIEDAVRKMKGIRCGARQTSCPDQIAQALETLL